MNLKLVVLVTTCVADGAILAGEEAKKSDIPTIRLPFSPIFPFQTTKSIRELDGLFAKAKPGATIECDLIRAAFRSGQRFGTDPEIKRGTVTLHTEKGYVELSSRGATIKPSTEKAARTFASRVADYSLYFYQAGKDSVVCNVSAARVVVEDKDYTHLPLPVRRENEDWRARLKISLSPDFDGSIKWLVDVDPK